MEKKLHVDTPVKFCAVKLSDVQARGGRLEASVFDTDAVNARQLVMNGKFSVVTFGELATSAYYPNRFKRVYCKKNSGEPFFLPSQMTDVRPKAEKFISRATPFNLEELRPKENSLLFTRSGTIGSVAYVSKTLAGKIFSDDVIRVSFKKSFDAGYIYAYLKSSVGQQILLTNRYGAVIEHIEPAHLEQIPVPDAPDDLKQRIHELIVRSYELRDESNALIDEAEKILRDELNLPPLEDFQGEKIFSVKMSNLDGRLDASFHAPIARKIVEHLKTHAKEVMTIGDERISDAVILPGRFKRVYVDEKHGIPFFSGRSIGELDPSDKEYLSFAQHSERIRNDLTIREKMILVTCSGTVGNIALVPKHWDGWAMTHDIIRLIPTAQLAGYVYVWLQSVYANEIIKSLSYGAVVMHIEKFHLEAVPVPLLKNFAAQEKINALALSANEKRFEAYRLECTALKILDSEILSTP